MKIEFVHPTGPDFPAEVGRTEYYANQGEFCEAVFDGPPVAVA